jgi:tRNA nucleotidyltransferase (CCA-adding enzyme)
MTKIKDKELIDIEKLYKNKQEIMMNMNSAKMGSPIVLIDPTYKERNALAALSSETLEQFKIVCRNFLKKPAEKAFETKKIDLGRMRKNAQKNRAEFILFRTETDKQEGDVAGSKLVKFYKHLGKEIEKLYKISNKGFEYNEKKEAEYFFVVKGRGEIIQIGPNLIDKENVAVFRKHHKNIFVKKGRIYARDKAEKKIEEFIADWKSKNSEKMKEMHITNLEIIKF